MMKRLLPLLSLVACSTVPPAEAPSLAPQIETMRQETVALLVEGRINCSGVWIGGSEILTAAHCTSPEDAASPGVFQYAVYGEYDASGDRDSTDAHPRLAHLLVRDEKKDLAILVADVASLHPVAFLSGESIYAGERVHIVGHTMGLPYTYSPAYVSGVRVMVGPDPISVEVVQMFAGATHGNSGGGVFDDAGGLIGICSYGAVPWMFAVSRDTIAAYIGS